MFKKRQEQDLMEKEKKLEGREKVFLFIVFSVLFFLIFHNFLSIKYWKEKKEKKIEQKKELSIKKTIQKIKNDENNLDTDKDGLKDWEEALYHTDPNNQDTDMDGISDYDEIKMNRNPNVFGLGVQNSDNLLIENGNLGNNFNSFSEIEKSKIALNYKDNYQKWLENLAEEERVSKLKLNALLNENLIDKNRNELKKKEYKTNIDNLLEEEKKLSEKKKKNLRKDLNFLGQKLFDFKNMRGSVSDQEISNFFGSLFQSVYLKKNWEKLDLIAKKKKRENIEKIILLSKMYFETEKEIKNIKYHTYEVKNLALKIAKEYQKVGYSLQELSKKIHFLTVKEKTKLVDEYAEAVKNILVIRVNLNNLIQKSKIYFFDSEPGHYLEFGI